MAYSRSCFRLSIWSDTLVVQGLYQRIFREQLSLHGSATVSRQLPSRAFEFVAVA